MPSNDNGFRRLTSPVGGFRRIREPIALVPSGGSERVCVGKAQVELALRLWDALCRLLSFALEPDQDPTLVVVPSPSPKHGLLLHQAAASLNIDRYLLFCSAVRPSSAACWASVDFTAESCSSHSSRYSGWAISFGQQRVLFRIPSCAIDSRT